MITARFIARLALFSICSIMPITLLAQADRIAGQVDATHLLKVAGNHSPLAKPAADLGAVDPAMKLNFVHLMLKPSPAQQTDIEQLLTEQQKRDSPNFHKWLKPEQYADRFGVSQADIAKISLWLQSQGFDIITVGRGRRFIAFNATAQQIQNALKTEIHHYRVNGELHFANVTDPSVPAAIQPLVLSFVGLDDFEPKPMLSPKSVKPLETYNNENVLGPADLGIIYDVLPIWQAGYTGSGMQLAIIGRSNVQLSDIDTFRSLLGLPVNEPQVILVPGSNDPGIVMGDEGESDLDLEYSGGIAPDAQILFVYAPALFTALNYVVDQQLAPVMSMSYGACELEESSAIATTWQTLAQQANTQGITWLNSSGDTGAAACDGGGVDQATHGAAVQLEPGVPEITGVGGLMFTEDGGDYWSSSVTNYASALSYIPEAAWNETAASGQLSAGGGGYSIYYTRAAWQVGPGIPAGTARGVPDVAMAAAAQHDPYFTIENGGMYSLVGGTSAATPTFAGIILLLNQYLGTYGLGNINPNLYWMAQTTTGVFHDIVVGWNGVPCAAGSPNCNSSGAFGYYAHAGWDAATGLGSVDATQLFDQWSTGAGTPQVGAVVNGASLTDSGLSPGLIFTVFGSYFGPPLGMGAQLDQNGNVSNWLAGVQVLVNGNAAPLLYLGGTQINAVAPYEIAANVGQTATVQVNVNGVNSNAFNVKVVATAPEIFSLGNNQGAILNQDYSVNGPNNPAARGSYIFIYGTGEGQLNPGGVDGQIQSGSVLPVPVAPVSLTIGGKSASVGYAGTASASIEGFFQVNAVVPSNIGTGNQPVVLKVGSASSAPLNVVVK